MSSRIIGLGETVMDILFYEKNSGKGEYVPFAAVPGGSTFNSMVSVGRSGVPCKFMGYTGNNRVGHQAGKKNMFRICLLNTKCPVRKRTGL